jgi:hypothetical protein
MPPCTWRDWRKQQKLNRCPAPYSRMTASEQKPSVPAWASSSSSMCSSKSSCGGGGGGSSNSSSSNNNSSSTRSNSSNSSSSSSVVVAAAAAVRPLVGVGRVINTGWYWVPEMCLYLLAYACAVSCDRWTSMVDNADMSTVCKLLHGSGRTAEQLTGLTGNAGNTKLQ